MRGKAQKILEHIGGRDDAVAARKPVQKIGLHILAEFAAEKPFCRQLRKSCQGAVFRLGIFAVPWGEEQVVAPKKKENYQPQGNKAQR